MTRRAYTLEENRMLEENWLQKDKAELIELDFQTTKFTVETSLSPLCHSIKRESVEIKP